MSITSVFTWTTFTLFVGGMSGRVNSAEGIETDFLACFLMPGKGREAAKGKKGTKVYSSSDEDGHRDKDGHGGSMEAAAVGEAANGTDNATGQWTISMFSTTELEFFSIRCCNANWMF